jgi:hypothetical protein
MKTKILLLIAIFLSTQLYSAENQSGKLWEKILPKLRKGLELTEKQEKLPNSSFLHEDKESNQKEINKLLDEAVVLLGTSNTATHRQAIHQLEADIRSSNKKIVEYEEARISAPDEKPAWKAWQTTKEDYTKRIEEQKKRISTNQKSIEEQKQSIRTELQTLGLDVNSEQIDFLLSTVVGENIIQVIVAFDNVKSLTLQLEQLMVQSGENVDVARRYYGMYMILLSILDQMYAQILNDIDRKYIPQIAGGKNLNGQKIEGIVPKTRRLMKETQKLLDRDGTSKNKQLLLANLQAQQLTLQAAQLYTTYLEKQRSELSAAKQRLDPDLKTARNTYETVKVSSELVDMMKSGRSLFESLRNIQIPELRIFQNLEMKKEFEKLTLELKAPANS